MIGRAFWRAAGRAAQAWGAGTNSDFASYSNWTVAHSVLTGTVPNNKFAKALGTDFTDVTPPEDLI